MRKKEVDLTDLKLLNEIQKNPKVTNIELSTLVNLSPAPTLKRVQNLLSRRILLGFRAEINLDYFKIRTAAVCYVLVKKTSSDNLKSRLMSSENVINLYESVGSNLYYETVVFSFVLLCKPKEKKVDLIKKLLDSLEGILDVHVFETPKKLKGDIYIFDNNSPVV